ncbi:MAG: TetR/AcrR family transcriptional regulator [Nakamurella sp.]
MSPRAASMSPEDRRASIVRAAAPLVRLHGRDVTTRQIAEAAGVAEGTLFRVFDDKEAILRAVVLDVLRPEPALEALDRIELGVPLEDFLATVVATVRERVKEIFEIAMAVRWIPDEARIPKPELDPIEQRLVDMLSSYRDELSLTPLRAAEVLRLLVFASTHPMINEGRPLPSQDIVTVMLNGIRRHDGHAGDRRSAKRRRVTIADPSP